MSTTPDQALRLLAGAIVDGLCKRIWDRLMPGTFKRNSIPQRLQTPGSYRAALVRRRLDSRSLDPSLQLMHDALESKYGEPK